MFGSASEAFGMGMASRLHRCMATEKYGGNKAYKADRECPELKCV